MSFLELLTEVRGQSRIDKLRLSHCLAENLAQSEQSTPFEPGQEHPLRSPDRAYDAAAVLLGELDAEEPSRRKRTKTNAKPKSA